MQIRACSYLGYSYLNFLLPIVAMVKWQVFFIESWKEKYAANRSLLSRG